MAITKTTIGLSNENMYSFLQTLVPEYFASVEYETEGDTTSAINCKDSDGNIRFSANYNSNGQKLMQIYVSPTVSIAHKQSGSSGAALHPQVQTAYKTSKGVLFVAPSNFGYASFLARTNDGALGGGVSNFAASVSLWNIKVGSWGEDTGYYNQPFSFMGAAQDTGSSNQTIICPIPSHAALGEQLYFDGVYCMPWAQYRNEGVITINGVDYATNGYIAIKDTE